ncbi:MAG: hypothetical protein RLZZ136_287 [Pseudomonadota bacterium]
MRMAALAGKALKCALPLALAFGLSGCINLGGGHKSAPSLLRLAAAQSAAAGSALSGNSSDAIIVVDPETDRSLAVTRLAVQLDDSRVAYLKDAQWVERPAHMFAALLAETIRAGGKHLVFASGDAVTSGGSRLSGHLLDFGYDARSKVAVVRYDAVWTAPGGAVTTKRFESRVKAVPAKPEVVGHALNQAANDVAAQVAVWLG